MTKPARPLPRFRTEAQERACWETEGRDVPYQSLIKVWLQEKVGG